MIKFFRELQNLAKIPLIKLPEKCDIVIYDNNNTDFNAVLENSFNKDISEDGFVGGAVEGLLGVFISIFPL